jgi:hypothetical protein
VDVLERREKEADEHAETGLERHQGPHIRSQFTREGQSSAEKGVSSRSWAGHCVSQTGHYRQPDRGQVGCHYVPTITGRRPRLPIVLTHGAVVHIRNVNGHVIHRLNFEYQLKVAAPFLDFGDATARSASEWPERERISPLPYRPGLWLINAYTSAESPEPGATRSGKNAGSTGRGFRFLTPPGSRAIGWSAGTASSW